MRISDWSSDVCSSDLFFEVDSAIFVSNKGDVSVRFEAEYELLITQRLVLQPSAELDMAVQEVSELGIGSGPSSIELGLRLRRSEEHTSELQSLMRSSYAVFFLKTQNKRHNNSA